MEEIIENKSRRLHSSGFYTDCHDMLSFFIIRSLCTCAKIKTMNDITRSVISDWGGGGGGGGGDGMGKENVLEHWERV